MLIFYHVWKHTQKTKIYREIREDVPTQPIEFSIESTRITQEYQAFFHTPGVELPSEGDMWQRKQEKRRTVQTEPPLINVSHCCTNQK